MLALLSCGIMPAVSTSTDKLKEANDLCNSASVEYGGGGYGYYYVVIVAVLLDILTELQEMHQDLNELGPIRNNTRTMLNRAYSDDPGE